MSILWSSGNAAFEPIHLEGDSLSSFEQTSRRARQVLAEAGLGNAAAEAELTTIGRELFERFFAAGVGPEVANWLRSLSAVESFEIGNDQPGQIPFAIFDDPQTPGPWGRRYPLAVGRRVSPLRSFAAITEPSILAVVDPAVRGQLSPAALQELDAFTARPGCALATSRQQLIDALDDAVPDLLWILTPLEGGAWIVADERITPQGLATAIRASKAGSALPLIVSTGIAGAGAVASWECFLSAATGSLPGVIALETPATAATACDLGLSFLRLFLDDKQPVARALQQVRLGSGPLGLAFSAFVPPRVHIAAEGAEGGPPTRILPDEPYQPFRPLEREERALLFGRDDDIQQCSLALDQPNNAGVFIHGSAGVGKASFVRAGLLPFLEEENRGFFVLRDRSDDVAPNEERNEPTLALRAGPDVVGALVLGLTAFAARPFPYTTPTGRTVSVDLPAALRRFMTGGTVEASDAIQPPPAAGDTPTPAAPPPLNPTAGEVWDKVEMHPAGFGNLIEQLTRELPFDLLIPIEQFEDAVVLQGAKKHATLATAVLQSLAKSPARCRIVATLRTECLGQVQPLLGQDYSRAAWREYFLNPLDDAALTEAILAPSATERSAYASETPAQKYGFGFEAGVATQILESVKRQVKGSNASAVQLIHAIGSQLFASAQRRGGSMARAADVRKITQSDINGTIVARLLKKLPIPSGAIKAVRSVLEKLHSKRGGVVTRNLVTYDSLRNTWRSAVPMETALDAAAQAGPLVEMQNFLVGGKEAIYVSAPSDAIAVQSEQVAVTPAVERYTRSKIIDMLFLVIPLALLGMALTFYLTRQLSSSRASGQTKSKQENDRLREAEFKAREVGGMANRFALYSGLMAQAESALKQGNTLRGRQFLVTQQAPLNGNDIRGFEWFQLWRSINRQDATLVGHDAPARILAMAPDGKSLVSGDERGNVLLWNLDDLKEPLAARLKGLRGPVQTLAFAPDGSTIAGAESGVKILVWEAAKPGKDVVDIEPKATLATEGKNVLSLAFLGGSGKLAAGDEDKSVTLFDVATAKADWTAKDHTEPVIAMTTVGDGKTLVTASPREAISWTDAGKKDKSFAWNANVAVSSVAPSPDVAGEVLIAGSENDGGTLFTWKPGKDAVRRKGEFGPATTSLAALPAAKLIAVGGKDQTIRLVLRDENPRGLLGHVTSVRSLAGGGSRLASLGYDNAIMIWEAKSLLEADRIPSSSPITGLALDSQERILASANADGSIRFFDPTSGAKIGDAKASGPISSLAFSTKDNPLLLAAGVGNDVALWEVTFEKDRGVKTKELPSLKKHTEPVTCVAFAKDPASMLASGSRDKSVIVWSAAKAEPLHTLKHPSAVRSLYFNPIFLFSGDDSGFVRAFVPATGQMVLQPPRVHFGPITGIGDIMGNRDIEIICTSLDQSVRIWGKDPRAESYAAFQINYAHHQPVTALAQGKGFYATGAADGAIKTWDSDLPDERFTYNDHTGPVRVLIVGKNNDLLISGGDDGAIVIRRGIPRPTIGPAIAPAAENDEP